MCRKSNTSSQPSGSNINKRSRQIIKRKSSIPKPSLPRNSRKSTSTSLSSTEAVTQTEASAISGKSPGNNRYGRVGIPKCVPCRKAKAKCHYPKSDPDATCTRCQERRVPCGDKIFSAQHAESRQGAESQSQTATIIEEEGCLNDDLLPRVLAGFPAHKHQAVFRKLSSEMEQSPLRFNSPMVQSPRPGSRDATMDVDDLDSMPNPRPTGDQASTSQNPHFEIEGFPYKGNFPEPEDHISDSNLHYFPRVRETGALIPTISRPGNIYPPETPYLDDSNPPFRLNYADTGNFDPRLYQNSAQQVTCD